MFAWEVPVCWGAETSSVVLFVVVLATNRHVRRAKRAT